MDYVSAEDYRGYELVASGQISPSMALQAGDTADTETGICRLPQYGEPACLVKAVTAVSIRWFFLCFSMVPALYLDRV